MQRTRFTIKQLTICSAALIALMAIAPSSEAATAGACERRNSKTEFSTRHVRVYSMHVTHRKPIRFETDNVYACARRYNRRIFLGTINPGINWSKFYAFRPSGNLLAFAAFYEDYGGTLVRVVNLKNSKLVSNLFSTDGPLLDGESGGQVTALVAKPNGSVAWIIRLRRSIPNTLGWETLYQVRANDANGLRTIAEGSAINAHSLVLVNDTTIQWSPFAQAPLN
jgi:hypothetical protein